MPAQYKTFDTKADAQAWVRKVEHEMDSRTWRDSSEAEHTTLYQALERYKDEVTFKKKGAVQETTKINVIQRHSIAQFSLAVLSSKEITDFRNEMEADGKAGSTIQKYLAILSHLYNTAIRDWGMRSLDNQVRYVSKPLIGEARDRRLVGSEEERLLVACDQSSNPWLKPIVILAIETAMRKGELLHLEWKDVDLDRRVLKAKNKDQLDTTREIPLLPRAIKILQTLPRDIQGKVFPTTDSAIKQSFKRALKRACEHVDDFSPGKKKPCNCLGIVDFRFHDLRHEGTSRLAEIFDTHNLAKITGHKTLQMLMRYNHPTGEDLADEAYRYLCERKAEKDTLV